MSGTVGTPYSGSLKTKKKEELKQIASELKVDDEGTKQDLEDRIREKLSNDPKARGDTRFTKLFESFAASSSAAANSIAENGHAMVKSVSGGAARKKGEELVESPDKALKELTKATQQKVARLPSPSRALQSVETSTREVAVMVETQSNHLLKVLQKYLHTTSIQNQAIKVQKKLSTADVVVMLTLALEMTALALEIIPFTWKLSYGPWKWLTLPLKSSSPIELSLPDLMVILKWQNFWKPILVYDFFTILIPAILGFLINFELNAAQPGGRSTRAALGIRKISLVTFSIVRFAIVYYLAFVHTGVGKGPGGAIQMFKTVLSPELLVLSTGVQGAFALYEAVIKHR